MAPRWISTKNINAKDKPAQLCAHLHPPPNTTSSISKWPPKAFAKLQGHLWASCLPHFSESFLKKKKNKKQIKKKKKKTRTFFCFFLFCFFFMKPPHHLKVLHVLIIRFQNTKLVLHTVPMERPPQQDSHRCCHERAAGCPPPLFAAWAATGF